MTTGSLLERHAAEWRGATRHPFLQGVQDGSLPRNAFDAWLVQDYLYVNDLLAFQARLLARAPRADQAVLAAGCVALEAELGWFEAQAGSHNLPLVGAKKRHATTERYRALLESLSSGAPYVAAVVALWAIERAYLEAWRGAAPGSAALREFVDHWTVPAFSDYVVSLERAADAALRTASDKAVTAAENAFEAVARLEADFWEMAWSTPSD